MEVTVSNVIRVKDPPEALVKWCRANLVFANPEYAKKKLMNFSLYGVPREVVLYYTDGNTLVLPYGVLKQIKPFINKVTYLFKPAVKVNYGEPIPLYDYQKMALNQSYMGYYGILQSPAGSGKTQIGLALVQLWGKRALWLTHTKDLLKQSYDRAAMYFDKNLLGTITEGKANIGTGITFATVQTMRNMDLSQYKDTWDVIIVDECHRVAGSPTKITSFSKVLNALSARHKYGLSATVHRADGLIAATFSLLGNVIYEVPASAVEDKVMKVGINRIATGTGLDLSCLNTDGTLNYVKTMNHLGQNYARNSMIVDCLINNEGHSCLVLSSRLEQLETLLSMLPDRMREQAVMISGDMTTVQGKKLRTTALEDMRSGKKLYLFATYQLAKEGLDIPRLDRLFMATPEHDYAIIVQSIGRIARTFDGKQEPIAYDFVDNFIKAKKWHSQRCNHYKKIGCYFVGGETQ